MAKVDACTLISALAANKSTIGVNKRAIGANKSTIGVNKRAIGANKNYCAFAYNFVVTCYL